MDSPSRLTRDEQQNKAFTLIELLVVISIVSILMAILLPALKKARDAARTSICLSNQRQCIIAANTYGFDYNDALYIKRSYGGNVKYWVYPLAYQKAGDGASSTPRYLTRDVTLCPQNQFSASIAQSTDPNSLNTWFGYAIYMPGGTEMKTRGWSFQKEMATTIDGSSYKLYWHQLNEIINPAKTICFADSFTARVSSSMFYWAKPAVNFRLEGSGVDNSGQVHFLHNNAANVMFFDGHAGSRSGEALSENIETHITTARDSQGNAVTF